MKGSVSRASSITREKGPLSLDACGAACVHGGGAAAPRTRRRQPCVSEAAALRVRGGSPTCQRQQPHVSEGCGPTCQRLQPHVSEAAAPRTRRRQPYATGADTCMMPPRQRSTGSATQGSERRTIGGVAPAASVTGSHAARSRAHCAST